MNNYTKDQYTLQRLLPDDWEKYKSIRLEALQTNPEMFGSNYTKESAYDQNEWQALLENERRAMFVLYDHTELIGITGVGIRKEDLTTAILIASFIKHPYRGRGLSRLFFQARIDWAKHKNCQFIEVSHRSGNEQSKAAIQSFGFQYSHKENILWPDGIYDDELVYKLRL